MKDAYEATYSEYLEMKGFQGWNIVNSDLISKAQEILEKRGYSTECPGSDSMEYLFMGGYVKNKPARSPTLDDGWSMKIFSTSRKKLEEVAKTLGLPKPKK